MPLENEVELPNPLTSDEIKDGIAFKVAEAVRASLDTTCHLYGKSYPKFQARIIIEYELEDFGRVVKGMRMATVGELKSMPDTDDSVVERIVLEVPYTPPNQFRRETEQAIPTSVRSNGRTVEKSIKYVPKKKVVDRD